jgi:hypothetical protein
MAVQITTYGETYQLHSDYQIDDVEQRIVEAIGPDKSAVTFRDANGGVLVFSIGGVAPLAISEYDPDFIPFT